jgi:hypothetical protein
MVLTYHARVFIISCLVLLALLPSADAQNLDTSSAVHASCALPPRYCAGAASSTRPVQGAPKKAAKPKVQEYYYAVCEVPGPCGRCDCPKPRRDNSPQR